MPNIQINDEENRQLTRFLEAANYRYGGTPYNKKTLDEVKELHKVIVDGVMELGFICQPRYETAFAPDGSEVMKITIEIQDRANAREREYHKKGFDIDRKVYDAQKGTVAQKEKDGLFNKDLLQ